MLSAIACDILKIPVSIVASMQAFSASGPLIDPRRTMLSKEPWRHARAYGIGIK